MIGAISFNNLLDMKSTPELDFDFSWSQVRRISISEILENWKVAGLQFVKLDLKSISVGGISAARFGPIWETNELKPFS